MAEDRVDEASHADAVEQIALEAGPSHHGTGDDGAGGVSKRELEQPERHERNAGRAVGVRHTLQEEVVVSDPPVARAEHEREAEHVERDATDRGVDDALDHDVRDFARSGEATFEHHEPGLHEEHQERREQSPHGVDRIDDVLGLHGRVVEWRRARVRAEVPDDSVDHGDDEPETRHLPAEIRHEIATRFALFDREENVVDHER